MKSEKKFVSAVFSCNAEANCVVTGLDKMLPLVQSGSSIWGTYYVYEKQK